MSNQYSSGLWVGGREIPAESGGTFPVMDPGNGTVLGHAARGMGADVERAVEEAQRAFRDPSWHDLDPHLRGRLLVDLARKIEERKEDLARVLSLENGKPISQARDEVSTTMRNFEFFGGWADKVYGRVVPMPEGAFDYILHEPLGVVAHIIPWNYPLDIFARGVAPCLAVGNTVVVKPAEETPFGAMELARLAGQVGIPPGVINVVTGTGAEAGALLAAHPGIQGLAFCGSVATGKEVLAFAARQITPVISLELGGKSPCLIFPDGEVMRAAESVAWGICYNTGQSCGALSRLIVPRQLADEVAETVKRTMASIRLGYGLDDPDMGPLVSEEQLQRVLGYIRLGTEQGATLFCGGRHPTSGNLGKGYFIEPALFVDARPGMRIVEEEVFGPVTCLLIFDSEEEAVHLANASNYGLSAEIWTGDLSRAHRVAAQLEASHVTVNGSGGFGVEAPFGGIKHSGFGREGGWESILQYSRVKNVWMKIDRKGASASE